MPMRSVRSFATGVVPSSDGFEQLLNASVAAAAQHHVVRKKNQWRECGEFDVIMVKALGLGEFIV
jgi:hypothetical protein